MASSAEQDELISQFIDLTNSTADNARQYLEASEWDIQTAFAAFYAADDEVDDNDAAGSSEAPSAAIPEPPYTGPRTLDGRPAPQSASGGSSSAQPAKKQQKRKGLATLSSLGGGDSHDHADDDDDEGSDDDHPRGPRDLFAGGEKSGLAIQDPARKSSDPKRLIKDIVAKARENAKRTDGSPGASPQPGPSRFRGTGVTLGGDGVESREIPDPRGAPIPKVDDEAPSGETQQRTLHLWSDGFSVDEGPLRRFDDPQNAADLQMIRQGRAPLHLMNVRYDQPVDVKLVQHSENWRPLPKVYRPFGGEGHRLGSPVPGAGGPSTAPAQAATSSTAQSTSNEPAKPSVDESQPTIMLRIQLPDGTRLPARFNTSQTVGDVYDFVGSASPDTRARAWVLATTFPNKNHEDKSVVLGDAPEFKKGGTAVVKWI